MKIQEGDILIRHEDNESFKVRYTSILPCYRRRCGDHPNECKGYFKVNLNSYEECKRQFQEEISQGRFELKKRGNKIKRVK